MSLSLEDLAARLAALEDKEAIRALKARYLRACDLKQPDVVRDCFAPGNIRIAYQNFPEFTDRDAFVDIYREMGCQPGVYDIHHATNAEIELTGADSATGKWALNFRTILTGPRQIVRLAVEYEDVYAKVEGRWLSVETVSHVTSMLTEQVGEDGSVTVLALAEPPAA
ncbi:MAG: nuclear transport factor 2 family protein [Novosphingobium sp.]|nr:nuclear transport factor 2 family protein [Novosphingobium sp.]